MNAPRFLRALIAVVPAIGLAACDRQAGTSDEHETTVAARLFLPDGSPASGARVRIYAVDDTSKTEREQVFATSDGSVVLPSLPAGEYNLVATDDAGRGIVIDSLLSTGAGAPQLRSDTLRPMGVITGRLQVEPQHSPRIAWVQIMGIGLATNVDTSGRFRLEVPVGRITLAALTRDEDYTPTFRAVRTISDSVLDIGTVRLEYTGIPVVQGLAAAYDPATGIVRVSWRRIAAFGLRGYALSRNSFGPIVPIEGADDTVFFDTLFHLEAGPGVGPASREYSIVGVDTSGDYGPSWNYVRVQAPSPWALDPGEFWADTLGQLPSGCYDVDTLGGGLVCTQGDGLLSLDDSLGLSSFLGNAPGNKAWATDDGFSWRPLPMLPDSASSLVAWRGLLWVARGIESGDSASAVPFDLFAKDFRLPLFGNVVVEAWSPQGRLVRSDTLREARGSFGQRLVVRGDTLLLSSDSAEWKWGGGPAPTGLMPVAMSVRGLANERSAWSAPFQSSLPSRWATGILRYLESTSTPLTPELFAKRVYRTRWQGMDLSWVGNNLFGRTDSSIFPKRISDRTGWGLYKYRGDGENVPALITWNGCGLLFHQSSRLLRICPVE